MVCQRFWSPDAPLRPKLEARFIGLGEDSESETGASRTVSIGSSPTPTVASRSSPIEFGKWQKDAAVCTICLAKLLGLEPSAKKPSMCVKSVEALTNEEVARVKFLWLPPLDALVKRDELSTEKDTGSFCFLCKFAWCLRPITPHMSLYGILFRIVSISCMFLLFQFSNRDGRLVISKHKWERPPCQIINHKIRYWMNIITYLKKMNSKIFKECVVCGNQPSCIGKSCTGATFTHSLSLSLSPPSNFIISKHGKVSRVCPWGRPNMLIHVNSPFSNSVGTSTWHQGSRFAMRKPLKQIRMWMNCSQHFWASKLMASDIFSCPQKIWHLKNPDT